MIPYSVLDLCPVPAGATPSVALANTLSLAQHAEKLGFQRYWLAEHHNMPGIASAATSIVIGHVAAGTSRIRVGSGGIMLPNHSPLVIAEQFGTLDALFPGRIDLGLGRAPGTDMNTARALRRDPAMRGDDFPQDVLELQALLGALREGQSIRAVPGAGSNVPLWILGSSLFGAQLAAELGLPFAFASHFAPEMMMQALHVYRAGFKPSQQLARPHAMLGISVFAADTEAEARLLFSSQQQAFINLRSGRPGQLPPPVANFEKTCPPQWLAAIAHSLSCAVVGSPAMVAEGLEKFVEDTGADELMITANIYDHAARLRSFEIVAASRQSETARDLAAT